MERSVLAGPNTDTQVGGNTIPDQIIDVWDIDPTADGFDEYAEVQEEWPEGENLADT